VRSLRCRDQRTHTEVLESNARRYLFHSGANGDDLYAYQNAVNYESTSEHIKCIKNRIVSEQPEAGVAR
jgi:hypothetical protein